MKNIRILRTIETESDLELVCTQKALASEISKIMEKKNITAYTMAKKTGISVDTIYAFLNCSKDTSFSKISKILHALDVRLWVEK